MHQTIKNSVINPNRKVSIAASQALKEKEYWMSKLSGELIKSNFPYDFNSTILNQTDIQTIHFEIKDELHSRLMSITKKSDPKLHMILSACVFALLYKYTGNDDVIICTSIDTQDQEMEFINTILPLRIQITPELTFKKLLLNVMEIINEAIEHQNYPVEVLLHDDLGLTKEDESSLFSVAVILENIQNKKYIEHIGCKLLFDFKRADDSIEGILEYDANIYRKSTCEWIITHYMHLLQQLVFQVDTPLTSINIITEEEKKLLIQDFNENKNPITSERSVFSHFQEYVVKTPCRIAITFEGKCITYSFLYNRVIKLSNLLKRKGIEIDSLIGIIMRRSPLLIEVILAIWESGGAYIPIDRQYPVRRVSEILNDSNARILFTEPNTISPELNTTYVGEVVELKENDEFLWSSLKDDHSIPVETTKQLKSLAYVIYTSGSTGKPKGVMVEHLGMMNHIYAKINDLQITDKSIIAQNSSYTFDISVWQLFTALTRGGIVSIYSYSLIVDPPQFICRIIEDHVTILEVVPSYLAVMLTVLNDSLKVILPLTYILVTGEEVKSYLVRQWFETYPDIKMVNAYGPTEASDDITHHIMDKMPAMQHIPIGKPLQNFNLYIFNEQMKLCPFGVPGEICVSGIGVGRGYLNDVEKTATAFVDNPHREKKGMRLYKTGDIGRWLPNGIIEFFGRKDYQVKIRGFRIELGEIESKLLELSEIKDAVVIDKEDEKGNKFLCAYLIKKDNELNIQNIKNGLAKSLPNYMVPAHFVQLKEIPLTPNGKIDRNSLPDPVRSSTIPYISESMLRKAEEEVGNQEFSQILSNNHLSDAEKLLHSIGQKIDKEKSVLQDYSKNTKVDYYPLTYPQKMIYYIEKKNQGTGCNNIVFFIRYPFVLNDNKLEDTLNILVKKHQGLRLRMTEIQYESNFIPAQYVTEYKPITIDRFDFSGDSDESQVQEWLEKKGAEAFNFLEGRLFYFAFLKLRENESGCYMRIHNIVSDGLTFHILIKEMNRIYTALAAGQSIHFKPDQSSYLSFISHEQHYLKSPRAIEDMTFFLRDMIPPPTEVTLSSTAVEDDSGLIAADRLKLTVKSEVRCKIHKYLKKSKSSLYKLILSSLAIYISRITGADNFIIGSLINNRSNLKFIKTAGIFIHFVPLHLRVNTEMDFDSFVKQTGAYLDDIIANRQQYPFEILTYQLRELFGIDPSYFYNINLIGYPDLENVTMERPFSGFEEAPFSLYVNRYNKDIHGSLEFEWIFRKGTFNHSDIIQIHQCLENVMHDALSDPEKRISEIQLLSDQEQDNIIANFSKFIEIPDTDYPKELFPNPKAYIVNERETLQPVGIPGELCFGKDKPNPELPLYRTGKLASWNSDGSLHLIGKIDHLLNWKGKRFDVTKIEAALKKISGIEDAVIEINNYSIAPFLCAYIVTKNEIDESNLKEYLSTMFPSHMLPKQFAVLERIPLTVNNQVDRKILKKIKLKIDSETMDEELHFKDEIEEKLAYIWSDILALETGKIKPNSNFFDLGGHSLSATILAARIHKAFNVKISLADIFKTPDLMKLATFIKGLKEDHYEAIIPTEKKENYPLASSQKRLYILQKMESQSIAYNLPQIMVIKEEPDKIHWQNTVKRLIKRHESLRTSFHLVDEEPRQKVHERVEFEILNKEIRLKENGVKSNIDELIDTYIRPFDLSQPPLIRMTMIQIPQIYTHQSNNTDEPCFPTQAEEYNKQYIYLLVVDMHHIISDWISHPILIKDFIDLYIGKELPPLKLQYKDFSNWQISTNQQKIFEEQKQYWVNCFTGDIPVLNLPLDYSRPVVQSMEGNTYDFEIDRTQTKALNQIAHKKNTTLYVVLMALFHVLLSKISGQDDIVIGTPSAGRNHTDLEKIIGMFVNTLAIRNQSNGQFPFSDFLQKVQENTLYAFENQDFPFEELVEQVSITRNFSRNPLFDVMFSFLKHNKLNFKLPGLTLHPYKHQNQVSKFDLTLWVSEGDNQMYCTFEYCTKLFKEESIAQFTSFFKKIISAVLEDPGQKLCQLQILSQEERHRLLFDLNETTAAYPENKTIHEIFESQTALTPHHIALNQEDIAFSYSQLNSEANQWANGLAVMGTKTDMPVGIMANPSIKTVVAIIGILKAGAPFLPLDPQYPAARNLFILEEAETEILITQRLFFQTEKPLSGIKRLAQMLFLDDRNFNSSQPFQTEKKNSPQDLAYIIYTSGTSGKPKGTMIPHRGLVNYIWWAAQTYIGNQSLNFPFYTSIAFDLTITSIFTPLATGNAIVVYEGLGREFLLDRIISENRVGVIKVTPPHLQLLQEKSIDTKQLSIKCFIVGGESLDSVLAEKIHRKFSGVVSIYNEYGPTETVVGCMIYRFDPKVLNGPTVSIGKPINNTQIYLLDKELFPVPKGIPGEICVSGHGVCRGYLKREDLNQEKFINNPFLPGQNMYRTGDLARRLSDDNIEFLGRIDQQVKIRGFRVELEEIENLLLKHDEIRQAVVTVRKRDDGDQFLTAYLVAERQLISSELREYLAKELPDYMIPSYFVHIDKIPLTHNGKVDKKILQSYGIPMDLGNNYEPLDNQTEEFIASLWKDVLHIDKLGALDNFFDVGGHSLHIIRINEKLKAYFQKDIPVVALFRYPTIRSLAQYLENKTKENEIKDEVIDDALNIMEETAQIIFQE